MLIFNKENKILTGVGIYAIHDQDWNVVYIGSTINFNSRYKDHLYSFLKNKKFVNKNLERISKVYDTMFFTVITECEINYLFAKEEFYIKKFNKKLLNIHKIPKHGRIINRLSDSEILHISELYNSGMSACKISEVLYNTRDKRSLIAKIVRGDYNPKYKKEFNYKPYDQTGKGGLRSKKMNQKNFNYILENYGRKSLREIGRDLNISYSTVKNYCIKLGLV